MAEPTPIAAPGTPPVASAAAPDDRWRQTHLGRLMGSALRRFDARVLQLMARNVEVPLALSNLAARDQVTAAHVHITRHLALSGDRLTDLAQRAGMTKQAMAHLVDQCEAWGLVTRAADALDARARRVCFTPTGLAWRIVESGNRLEIATLFAALALLAATGVLIFAALSLLEWALLRRWHESAISQSA